MLRVYCDLLRSSGAIHQGYEPWMEELAAAVDRGHTLVASLLDSLDAKDSKDTSVTAGATAREPATQVVAARARDSAGISGKAATAATSATISLPAVDLADALRRRLPLLERLAGSGIQVTIDSPADAGKAAIAEGDLERILQNLVGNAIEAMPNGGELRIALRRGHRKPMRNKTRARRSDAAEMLQLRVQDTGMGISADHVPQIFQAGVSSKQEEAPDSQPRGFGLAIVRELTERAGGSVSVRSRPGEGSCFEVELPEA